MGNLKKLEQIFRANQLKEKSLKKPPEKFPFPKLTLKQAKIIELEGKRKEQGVTEKAKPEQNPMGYKEKLEDFNAIYQGGFEDGLKDGQGKTVESV